MVLHEVYHSYDVAHHLLVEWDHRRLAADPRLLRLVRVQAARCACARSIDARSTARGAPGRGQPPVHERGAGRRRRARHGEQQT